MGRHAQPFPEQLDRTILFHWQSGLRNFERIARLLGLYDVVVRHRLIVMGAYVPKDPKTHLGKKREQRTDTGRARQMRTLRLMS